MTSPADARWRVRDLVQQLDETESDLLSRAAAELGVTTDDVEEWNVARRSIDARGRRAPRFILTLDLRLTEDASRRVRPGPRHAPVADPEIAPLPRLATDAARPIVLGMGPCGLFAALQLVEAGLRPVVIDRGKPVETRARDVSRLMNQGVIDPESNLCFGEGGAGTWSDGKLYTRVGGPWVREILQTIVRLGGPDRILVDARPHLGTDRLVALLKAFRAALTLAGCELRFETRLDAIRTEHGRFVGVTTSDGEHIDGTHLVLASGHSARDLYEHLALAGVPLQPKAFAVGFRVEHPQRLIDELQYGPWCEHPALPAAYYELTANIGEGEQRRGVYSFCMCPGGSIVPTPTREGEVCVNGMSHAARSGKWANSALVVTVDPTDFGHAPGPVPLNDDRLRGVAFQRAAEARAWELGGGAFVAPAQRLVDFLAGRPSSETRRTSYKRGVQPADLATIYPAPITEALRAAVRRFDANMRGYLSEDAVLVGVETRTSAPVTVLRDPVTLESPAVSGLFPAGEGAGYGGGIVSAAVDGIRVARRIVASLSGTDDPNG